jgi:hypothetical protein
MIYGVEDEWTTLAKLPVSKTTLRVPPKIISVFQPPPSLTSSVRFDNEGSPGVAGLTVDSQTVSDSSVFTVSLFFRPADTEIFDQFLLSLGDASGNQFSKIELIRRTATTGTLESFFTNPAGTAFCEFVFNEAPVMPGNYYHVFMSTDLNHPAGAKICNLVVNGLNQTINTGASTDSDPAFVIPFNGGNFGLPDETKNLFPQNASILDFQEVWVALGQYVDPSNVSLFRDPSTGLPVDLGADGSLPTGTPPTYYFRGNAASFPTNLGNGEQPHVIGILSNAP